MIQLVAETCGSENAQIARESHDDRGDRSRLNDEEQRPAVEKSPQRRIRFAQVNVLAARLRHHRRKFAVGERRGERHESGDDPREREAARRARLPRDVRGDEKNSGADHRADDDHRRIEDAQLANETSWRSGGRSRRRNSASRSWTRRLRADAQILARTRRGIGSAQQVTRHANRIRTRCIHFGGALDW